jgi:hypothetical protein
MTRSGFYTAALREYLARHQPQAVTEALDAVYATEPTGLDPALAIAARRSSSSASGKWRAGAGPGLMGPVAHAGPLGIWLPSSVLVVQGNAFNRVALLRWPSCR